MALKGTTQSGLSRRRLDNLCYVLQGGGKELYIRWRKKIRRGLNALCEYQPRAYLIGSGMLGSWDGSIWLQEDSLCLPEMLVAHGSDMSYMCRCKLTYESKELLLLIAHIEGRKWRMLLNCQI